MSLMGDAMLGRPEGVKVAGRAGPLAGATEAEIPETVRMAFYFGGIPALVTATHAYRK